MINLPSKLILGLIVFSLTTVSILFIPLSKQASKWNRCIRKTSASLGQLKSVQSIDDQSKEVLSVMICNGAVFEPKFKSNIQ